MVTPWVLILLTLAASLPALGAAPEDGASDYLGPGALNVEVLLDEWHDAARDRTIPYKVYYPTDGTPPYPVIVFSHGLGGSREGYEFQGRHWASHGYVSVHLQHPGSDESVWRDVPPDQRWKAMAEATKDWRAALDRPRDVRLAVDRLMLMNDPGGGPLTGLLDMKHLGIAGHSFGAWTAQMVAGQIIMLPNREVSLGDPRFTAAVFESPNHTERTRDPERSYNGVTMPCLHLTGTDDNSPFEGLTDAENRVVPFQYMHATDQYLCVFDGGDHMVFSGRLTDEPRPTDARFHALIQASTLAFFDAYLKSDPAARAWLAEGGFAEELGEQGTFEVKQVER